MPSTVPTQNTAASDSLVAKDPRRRIRHLKDRAAEWGITLGGIGVIIAVVLIFFYLLLVVTPLFSSAKIHANEQYPIPGSDERETLVITMEEQAEVGMRVTQDARLLFFDTRQGQVIQEEILLGDEGLSITALGIASQAEQSFVAGLPGGSIVMFGVEYDISYPNDIRTITPSVTYSLGQEPVQLADTNLLSVAGRLDENGATFAGATTDGRVRLSRLSMQRNFLTGATTIASRSEHETDQSLQGNRIPDFLLIDPNQEWLYIGANTGELLVYRLSRDGTPTFNQRLSLTDDGEQLSALRFLTGGISLIAGTSDGRILQYFPLRDDNNDYSLIEVRRFEGTNSPVTDITTEERRKGFIVAQQDGNLGVYYTTSQRNLLQEDVANSSIAKLAVSPRGNVLLVQSVEGWLQRFEIENEHPEVSWHSLWQKVWYESYPEPEYVWQSSSASNDFEPKFSLVPLSFGTLKAAFYAMLFAVPLAIMGAIFTAYFMPPKMRRAIKPTIEVMEALPTVILGFLAGLWLAPMLEANLPAIFMLLVMLPLAIPVFAYLWAHLPSRIRFLVPDGWEPVLLIPVVVGITWFAFLLGSPIESAYFGGNMPQWISTELGISFDQRNSIVVGFAMGFAVIPTIFSITEDAIFGVPKHLSFGSLALGATPWQTLVRVVMPTASPGIFSALMIGFGRAVGETMIVLMATGNTPVMDLNIFQGMRTLSANIAVEMPESEVDSTHYRVLFLAALVLFMFTFVFNTVAEIVRQRLRAKYSNI